MPLISEGSLKSLKCCKAYLPRKRAVNLASDICSKARNILVHVAEIQSFKALQSHIFRQGESVPDISFPVTKPWGINSDGNCLIASVFSPSDKLLHKVPVLEYLNMAMAVNRGRSNLRENKVRMCVTLGMMIILKVERNGVLVHSS
jgi:hypothetical protein